MKKQIFALALLLFVAKSYAQTATAADAPAPTNDKFVKAVEKQLTSLDTCKSMECLTALANTFERIASKETGEWLSSYYAAYTQLLMTYFDKDVAKVEVYCDKADKFIEVADKLMPKNSEIALLKAMSAGSRIRINPMVNGQKYAPIAGAFMETAKALDPENPRVYMQQGISTYFTPPMWGGSKEKGKEMMETAAKKYETFKPASSIHPNWGKTSNEKMLEMANKG